MKQAMELRDIVAIAGDRWEVNSRNSLREIFCHQRQYLPSSTPVLRVQVALRTCLERFHFCFASTTEVVFGSMHMQQGE